MSVRRLGFVLAVLLLTAGLHAPGAFGEEMQTAPHVDLSRYQGKWYEIARLPLRWENKCASNVTATYTLRPDGKVDVLNQCGKADGSSSQSHGTAKLATKDGSNAKLKVTFFWPFYGDYWILDIDPGYQWVLVGTPNAKNLWILSRTPSLNKDVYERLIRQANQLGFDTSKLIHTRQD